MRDGISFNHDRKYDIQLSAALIAERRLGDIFGFGTFDTTLELKTETFQWEQTGNIAIEYKCDGKPSGISTTEADYWVHELCRDGATLLYVLVPMPRMKEITRRAIKAGRHRQGGDDNRFRVALIKLADFLHH